MWLVYSTLKGCVLNANSLLVDLFSTASSISLSFGDVGLEEASILQDRDSCQGSYIAPDEEGKIQGGMLFS